MIAAARTWERQVVSGYVPADRRAGFAALLDLDDMLGRIVRTTSEPIVGQMRLTWWYEALIALDGPAARVGEPVLNALASAVVPHGITGETLAAMIDGWEVLLGPDPLDAPQMLVFARARGATMAAALAAVLGGAVEPAVNAAGEGWALADLAVHLRDAAQASLARSLAMTAFVPAFDRPWRRPLRPIGMLALLARADLAAPSVRPGSPRRLGRLLMHRIWGR